MGHGPAAPWSGRVVATAPERRGASPTSSLPCVGGPRDPPSSRDALARTLLLAPAMSDLRRSVPSLGLAPVLLLTGALAGAATSGCSESHTTGAGDAGGTGDAPRIGPTCGGEPPFRCVSASGTPHVCGDAFASPGCLDGGVWQCPLGLTPEPIVDCWCYGPAPSASCACISSGWWCEGIDAGVPAGCPPDPWSAEGSPCAPEGESCGRCLDSCGFCNLLVCTGGIWTHLEAFPPPPPCTSFPCGPELRCAAETEYCVRAVSDVGGEPDAYACQRLPDGCPSGDDCDCVGAGWSSCERGTEGGLTVTYPGG